MLKTSFVILSLMLSCTACSESFQPITDGGVTFNRQAADKLTPEQRRRMDIEFFNEFDVRKELPTEERKQRVIALAEAGFEPAWLSLRLFDYDHGNLSFYFKSYTDDYAAHWHRLKALADQGNASAQCLLPELTYEYNSDHAGFAKDMNLKDLPTNETDADIDRYRDAAAAQGQSYCLRYAAGKAIRQGNDKKGMEIIRECAYDGTSACEESLALDYLTGSDGLPKDKAKGLCWYMRAYAHSRAPGMRNMFIGAKAGLSHKIGDEALSNFLARMTPETDCDAVSFDSWRHADGKQ